MNRTKQPRNRELAWGTIHVMRSLDRPAAMYEIKDRLATFLGVLPGSRGSRHGRGGVAEFDNRVQSILSNLNRLGAIYDDSWGQWALTREGRELRHGTELYWKLAGKYDPPAFPIAGNPKQPSNRELAWGTLHVMKSLDRPALIYEIKSRLARFLRVPSSIRGIRHGRGPESEFDYRVQWILTNLKNVDAIYNSSRGEWTLAKAGREYRSDTELQRRLVRKYGSSPFPIGGGRRVGPRNRKCKCPESLRSLDPRFFEIKVRNFLIKSGFEPPRLADIMGGLGLEGTGLFMENDESIIVFIRCHKSVNAIGLTEVMDFRRAMDKRAIKGLLITTSSFTESAKKEAVRIGAPEIVLIDGNMLCDHLKRMKLGCDN